MKLNESALGVQIIGHDTILYKMIMSGMEGISILRNERKTIMHMLPPAHSSFHSEYDHGCGYIALETRQGSQQENVHIILF